MKKELEIEDIEWVIAQARRYRSQETGRLIALGGRRLGRALLRLADRALHLLLMSPTAPRPR